MTDEPTSGQRSSAHLRAPQVVRAALIDLGHEPVEQSSVVEGAPVVGHLGLDPFSSDGFTASVGVWEISEGVVTDVEVDELFIVLSGSATITVDGGAGTGTSTTGTPPTATSSTADSSTADSTAATSTAATSTTVARGDVVRLAAGMRTTWQVHEPLRKVYLIPGSPN